MAKRKIDTTRPAAAPMNTNKILMEQVNQKYLFLFTVKSNKIKLDLQHERLRFGESNIINKIISKFMML